MRNSTILGTGFHVPERVVTNDDLAQIMDTSDEWIRERTGVRQRHYVEEGVGPADLAKVAAEKAMADAGMTNSDIEMIVFATQNPDVFLPGSGCILQSKMEFGTIPAIDIRQQCSGFIYAVAVADRFIKTGFCDNVLVIGSDVHSNGLDFSDRGRDVTVIFGDGAGALVMGPSPSEDQGLLSLSLHCQGENYDKLWAPAPYGNKPGRITVEMVENGEHYPRMDGKNVFRHAIQRFPEAMNEAVERAGLKLEDVDLFIPHQANERISRMVAQKVGLPWEKVVSNIDRYGNTTAGTIPICIDESRQEGRLKKGDLLLCAAFGSGFTWGAFLLRMTI